MRGGQEDKCESRFILSYWKLSQSLPLTKHKWPGGGQLADAEPAS